MTSFDHKYQNALRQAISKVMTSQKWFFRKYGFHSIVWKNLSQKSSHAKIWLFSALRVQIDYTKLSYKRLVWDCVKLQTSLSSLSLMLTIWNFAHVLTAAVSITWWGLKVWMDKFAKWWRHTLELLYSVRSPLLIQYYFFFCVESLVRDTKLPHKDCSEMHSGSCCQMTPSYCKRLLKIIHNT